MEYITCVCVCVSCVCTSLYIYIYNQACTYPKPLTAIFAGV